MEKRRVEEIKKEVFIRVGIYYRQQDASGNGVLPCYSPIRESLIGWGYTPEEIIEAFSELGRYGILRLIPEVIARYPEDVEKIRAAITKGNDAKTEEHENIEICIC